MPSSVSESRTFNWTYFPHEGRVFCPQASAEVDASGCPECPFLQAELSDGEHIVCLSPQGERLSEMIHTILSV